MKKWIVVSAWWIVFLASVVSAQTITGTVTNGTSGKAAAGDDVALLSLSQGMQEVASTKTDAQGKFSFAAPADKTPHMVRVTHEGVNYFPQGGPLMPGMTSTQLTVYEVAKKIDGLSQTVEVNRYQSEDGKQLQVIALFAIRNESKPPRTLDADQTFEFTLPADAKVTGGAAKSPGGQPLNTTPSETGQKNRYGFSFPLKPGETEFQVQYTLPYDGKVSFTPKPLADVQHFVVMTPKGMTFTAKDAKQFQPMNDQSGAVIMVASNVKPGQDLAFSLSGSGVFQPEGEEQADNQGGAMGGQAGADNRPGGGLGAPLDVPDPLHNYRAIILGAFAVVLVMGGFYIVSQSNQRKAAAAAPGAHAVDITSSAPKDRSAMLLEALKEELFQLELDRQSGKIGDEEYAKSKAALDETIKRAVTRANS